MHFLNNIKPKKLFLVDSLGGLVSALMLGLFLASFESIFGMPQKTLYFLSFIACIFAIYSFFCFLKLTEHWRLFMKIIALANLLYCCLTIGLIAYLYQKLTILGLIYFILEITIIITLAILELKTASRQLN